MFAFTWIGTILRRGSLHILSVVLIESVGLVLDDINTFTVMRWPKFRGTEWHV